MKTLLYKFIEACLLHTSIESERKTMAKLIASLFPYCDGAVDFCPATNLQAEHQMFPISHK